MILFANFLVMAFCFQFYFFLRFYLLFALKFFVEHKNMSKYGRKRNLALFWL